MHSETKWDGKLELEPHSDQSRVFAVLCPDQSVRNVERVRTLAESEQERYLIEKAMLSSQPPAEVSSIPPPSELLQEFLHWQSVDEAAMWKRDSLQSTKKDLDSFVVGAASCVESAISEINLLVSMSSALQSANGLATLTSFQEELQPAAFPLPLAQRLHLCRVFFSSAAQRLAHGHERLLERVRSRQKVSSQLSLLAQRWRLLPLRGEGLAVDCSFGNSSRLAVLKTLSDGTLTAAATTEKLPSATTCTLRVAATCLRTGVSVASDAWTLLHNSSSTPSSSSSFSLVSAAAGGDALHIELECMRHRHDAMVREWMKALVKDVAALPPKAPIVGSTPNPPSPPLPNSALDGLLLAALADGVHPQVSIQQCDEQGCILHLSPDLALHIAMVPISDLPAEDSDSPSDMTVRGVLRTTLLQALESFLASYTPLSQPAGSSTARPGQEKRNQGALLSVASSATPPLLPTILYALRTAAVRSLVSSSLGTFLLPSEWPNTKGFSACPSRKSTDFRFEFQHASLRLVVEPCDLQDGWCNLLVFEENEPCAQRRISHRTRLLVQIAEELAWWTGRQVLQHTILKIAAQVGLCLRSVGGSTVVLEDMEQQGRAVCLFRAAGHGDLLIVVHAGSSTSPSRPSWLRQWVADLSPTWFVQTGVDNRKAQCWKGKDAAARLQEFAEVEVDVQGELLAVVVVSGGRIVV